jgi:5-methylcytosine-specific restriction endonuclease McrA
MTNKKKMSRPRGEKRLDLVLAVVASDSTFELSIDKSSWIGKCLHCNRKLDVALNGSTLATLEHIMPLTAGGSAEAIENLALACASCNNEKGIHHDQHVGKGGRADEVIKALLEKRLTRFRVLDKSQ